MSAARFSPFPAARGGRHTLRCLLFALLLAAPPVFAAGAAFDLQGHRGARGLAPENTLAGFRKALEIGVTTLETDLAMTRDGVLVLAHDPLLNRDIVRGADGKWLASAGPAIHALTLDEVRRLDVGRLDPASGYASQWPEQKPADGERIPTLEELFVLARGATPRPWLNLEIKVTPTSGESAPEPARFARAAVEAVRAAGVGDRVTIQSFDWRPLLEVRRIAPEIATVCLTIEARNMNTVQAGPDGASPWHAGLRLADHGGSLPGLVRAAGCGTWSMFWRNLTPDLVAQAKSQGLKVVPWTVNDPADMRRLIDWGVDGLITDYPDRLRAVLSAMGRTIAGVR